MCEPGQPNKRKYEAAGGRASGWWQRAYGLPPSLSHHRQPGIDSLAGLADWRHKQRHGSWRQLGC